MSTWNSKTTAEEVATAFQNDIRGKNVLVTGVSPNSLGAETVRVLAPYAKTIILASRSQSKIDETVASVKASGLSASLKTVILDLASVDSIKAAAADVNSFGIPIHVVINNAAVSTNPLTRTTEGFEIHFGVNHLGHFLFNSLILPSVRLAVKDTPAFPPRIVVVSSEGHILGGAIRFDDPNFEKRPEEYTKFPAYAQSKTANILYARALAKKLAPEGILAFALHPGGILETGMGSATTREELQSFGMMDGNGTLTHPELFKSIAEGTSTQVIAAFDSSLKDKSGAYLYDGNVNFERVADYAKDNESAEKLWTLSEELLGHKFGV